MKKVCCFAAVICAALVCLSGCRGGNDGVSSCVTSVAEGVPSSAVSSAVSSAAVSSQATESVPAPAVSSRTASSAPAASRPAPASSAVVPSSAPAAPVPPAVNSALGQQKVAELSALSNTKRGWGPGVDFDEKNRPRGAVSAQNAYGRFGSKYIVMSEEQKVYLTFDEGYENGYTPRILDVLKEKNVKAVFFITMPYAKQHPDLVRRMIAEGHTVGNHSTKHLSFPTMTLDAAYTDIAGLHSYVKQNFSYEMTLFRFPMGESSDRTQALIQAMGYTGVFWSFAYADWDPAAQPEPAAALQKTLDRVHPGAIYLLHAVSKTNTEILPQFIDGVRAKGYEFALVS